MALSYVYRCTRGYVTMTMKNEHSPIHRIARHCVVALSVFLCLVCSLPVHAAQDFQTKYARGKVLLRQKLYADAVKELYHAVHRTAKGRTHFGSHYFLAVAYYRLGNITRSMVMLKRAKLLIKNKKQRESRILLIRKIQALFGQLRILPQVDPDAVGRLLLKLEVKNAFSHPQKLRAYRIIRKFWSKKGLVIKGATLYLPKGDYNISIANPQCLTYGLTLGGSVMTEISIGDQASTLALAAKRSCGCLGGQIVAKTKKGPVCRCPAKTVWSVKDKRCVIPVVKDNRGWAAKNWGWLVLGGAVVVGGAAAGIIAWQLVEAQPKDAVGEIQLWRP